MYNVNVLRYRLTCSKRDTNYSVIIVEFDRVCDQFDDIGKFNYNVKTILFLLISLFFLSFRKSIVTYNLRFRSRYYHFYKNKFPNILW